MKKFVNENDFNIDNKSKYYDHNGSQIVITSYRLLNVNDVRIFNTQLSNQILSTEYSLDAIKGVLTINSSPLNDNEHLAITLL